MSRDFYDYLFNADRQRALAREQRKLKALLEEVTRKGSFFVAVTSPFTYTQSVSIPIHAVQQNTR